MNKNNNNKTTVNKYPEFIEILYLFLKAMEVDITSISKDISRWKSGDYISHEKKQQTLIQVIDQLVNTLISDSNNLKTNVKKDIINLYDSYQYIILHTPVHTAHIELILYRLLIDFFIPRIVSILVKYKFIANDSTFFKELEKNNFFLPEDSVSLQGNLPLKNVFNWFAKSLGLANWKALAKDKNGINENTLTELKRWVGGKIVPTIMKIELLIKDKAREKITFYTNMVKFARIMHYLIIKCQTVYVQEDIDFLKIKFLHDYNEFNNLFSSYASKYNEPWEYEQSYNQIIFQNHSPNGIIHLLDTAFWNYAWPHAPENNQRITSSEYNNFNDFVDNTLAKDYTALNYSTALLKIAALKNEREKFLGYINVLSLLLCTKREKLEGDEKNIESLFTKGELQSCYADYSYMIHYYRAKYLIQIMEYEQALKELKKAHTLAYNRDGIFLELIINDGCLLSAFLSRGKKYNIETFMLFYETGLWYGFFNESPREASEYILDDFKQRFLWRFSPHYYFKTIDLKEKSKKLQTQLDTMYFDFKKLDNLKPDLKHPDRKMKGFGPRPLPQLLLFGGHGYLEEVKKLVQNGADVNIRASDNSTLLIRSLQTTTLLNHPEENEYYQNKCKIAEWILDNYNVKKSINARTNQKKITALGTAIENGYSAIVKKLLNKGANPDLRVTVDDYTPLYYTMTLIHKGMELTKIKQRPFLKQAFEPDNYRKVNFPFLSHILSTDLYSFHQQVNQDPLIGSTIRMLESEQQEGYYKRTDKYLKIIDHLLEAGADIEAGNAYGFTPFIYACEVGTMKIIKKLIKAGADTNAVNEYNANALIIACAANNETVVTELVKYKPEINHQAYEGNTALHYACKWGNKNIVTTLVKHGARVNIKNSAGIDVITEAKQNGYPELIKLFQ